MGVTTKDKPVRGKVPTVIGFRIYYANRTIITGSTPQEWAKAPAIGIQVVVAFFSDTYECYYPDELVTRVQNYRLMLCGENVRPSADYYWFHEGHIGAGGAGDVPTGIAIPAVKLGTLIPLIDFKPILIRASFDHVWGADPPPPKVYSQTANVYDE